MITGALRRLLALACALVCLLAIPGSPTPAAGRDTSDPQVIADDGRDVYAGIGGLVVPRGSVDDDTRRHVAECPECRWRLRPACGSDGGPCLSVTRGCPIGRLLRTLTSRDAGRTWRDLGVACYPVEGPVTVSQTSELTREQVEEAVPGSSITRQPHRGVVPHLPVAFQSGQPARLPPIRMTVVGREIEVTPVATWRWRFGDGTERTTSVPGGPYPDLSVAHTYRRAGRYQVVLETTWTATYRIDDLGPFPLDPIHQRAEAVVVVAPALASLVPSR